MHFALGLCCALAAIPGYGQRVDERKAATVKAAFLYKFTKFVGWPARAFSTESAPMIIGVLGDGLLREELKDLVRDKKHGDHHFIVQEVRLVGQQATDSKTLQECHVLYAAESYSQRMSQILELLRDAPTLIVGEGEAAAENGATIAFVIADRRITLHVNRDTIAKSAIEVSSKLLSLAKVVHSKSTKDSPRQ